MLSNHNIASSLSVKCLNLFFVPGHQPFFSESIISSGAKFLDYKLLDQLREMYRFYHVRSDLGLFQRFVIFRLTSSMHIMEVIFLFGFFFTGALPLLLVLLPSTFASGLR